MTAAFAKTLSLEALKDARNLCVRFRDEAAAFGSFAASQGDLDAARRWASAEANHAEQLMVINGELIRRGY